MTTILVTGSEGSLMQAVIPRLLDDGYSVRGVDNFYRYGEVARERRYEFVQGDLADPQVAERAVQGVDGVIQAAARIYGVGGFHKYAADILSEDVLLHRNVLNACARHGVRRVAYVSSSMVFERAERHPVAETDALEARIPYTEYGLSKVVGERLSMAFRKQYGLEYVIWRPFNIITPYEKGENEIGMSHVFADFIRNIVHEEKNPLPIIGDGQQIRCFTWIDDIADAIARWSFAPSVEGETFNLGNPEPISMRDLARGIFEQAKQLGLLSDQNRALEFETVCSFNDDVRKRIPDISKATSRLGWHPSVGTEEAIRRCLRVSGRGAATELERGA